MEWSVLLDFPRVGRGHGADNLIAKGEPPRAVSRQLQPSLAACAPAVSRASGYRSYQAASAASVFYSPSTSRELGKGKPGLRRTVALSPLASEDGLQLRVFKLCSVYPRTSLLLLLSFTSSLKVLVLLHPLLDELLKVTEGAAASGSRSTIGQLLHSAIHDDPDLIFIALARHPLECDMAEEGEDSACLP